jgi:HEAT repeat protein
MLATEERLREGEPMRAFTYVSLTLFLGIGLLVLGGQLCPPGILVGEEPKAAPKPAVPLYDIDPKAEQQKSAKAVRDFADHENSKEDRRKAADDIGTVTPEEGEMLLHVFKDKEESDDIRVIALQKSPVTEQLIVAAATCVKQVQGTRQLRYECVGFLHTAESFDPAGHMSEEEVFPALRAAIADPEKDVRHRAAGYLVLTKDPDTHEVLRRALEPGSRNELFPKADTIHYLAAYRSRDDFPTMQHYLHDPNAAVRAAAAEALTAVDSEGLKEIVALLGDSSENATVKISILRGLSANHAKEFPGYSLAVIENNKEDPKVRAYAIEELAKVLNRSPRDFPERLRIRAKEVIGGLVKAEEKPLRDAAAVYLKIEEQLAHDGRE